MIELAVHYVRNLPPIAVHMLITQAFKPGALVDLNECQPITFAHLLRGAVWIKPWVMKFSDCIPSGFMMADVLLQADRILKGKLLQQAPPPPNEPAGFSHEMLNLLQISTTTELQICIRINKIAADGLSPNPFHRNPGVRIDALQTLTVHAIL